MKLSKEDANLFFELNWSIQSYVNSKLKIIPNVNTIDEYRTISPSDRLAVRDALYDNIDLIDSYTKENPHDLSKEELEIIKSWKKFERGDFFIERLLKKWAIFIKNDVVYGVMALYDSFEDMFSYTPLPYYVKAVLLPFKGQIIYDGLLQGYSVSFGGGIKSNLREAYMGAKQNNKIVESLDPQKRVEKPAVNKKKLKDYKPILSDVSQQMKKLRSSSGSPAIHSPAFSLAKASVEFTKLSVDDPSDIDALWKALKKVDRAIQRAETVLRRAEYY